MDNGGSVGTVKTGSKKHGQRQHHLKGIKGLVDYTSEVSSEDFSGPEDGEVDSDHGGRSTSPVTSSGPPKRPLPTQPSKQPRTPPPLVANASPINDDEDIDLGKDFLFTRF